MEERKSLIEFPWKKVLFWAMIFVGLISVIVVFWEIAWRIFLIGVLIMLFMIPIVILTFWLEGLFDEIGRLANNCHNENQSDKW